jgi:putative hydrolase of HD superfamily
MSALIVGNTVNPVKALNFFAIVGKLKLLKRTGWVNNNVFEPESVADHMYRMSMLTFMLTDADIKRDHLMKVCMIHDLAEALVGMYVYICMCTYMYI